MGDQRAHDEGQNSAEPRIWQDELVHGVPDRRLAPKGHKEIDGGDGDHGSDHHDDHDVETKGAVVHRSGSQSQLPRRMVMAAVPSPDSHGSVPAAHRMYSVVRGTLLKLDTA